MKGGWGAVFARARWVVRVARQRRWAVVAVAALATAIGVITLEFVPERFEASSRIHVDTQTVLKPMMVGLTYQPDIDQQVRILARTLISRPNVGRLLEQPDLGFEAELAKDRDALVTRLMAQIRIAAGDRGNLYTISFRDPSPERARRVVEGMVRLFVSSGADDKRRDSEDAGRFIEEQAHVMERKLIEAENRLKDFKVRNFGLTGVSNQDYFARVSVMADELSRLQTDLSAAEKSRDALRRELATEDPHLPEDAMPAATSGPASENDVRLEGQRKQLDELLRRFTEQHPDVINARRVVAELEQHKRQAQEGRARERGRPQGVAATSPIFQKLRIALAEAEAQVASLRSKQSALQARLGQTRAEAGRVPQVEAELAQLTRDYDVMRKNYDQLVARRESASLAVRLDESAHLADFRVIEPPRVAQGPVFPGHLHLALIAAATALVAGLVAAAAIDFAKPTLNDTLALEKLSARPVLGTVSLALTPAAQQAVRRRAGQFAAAVALLILFQIAWLAWLAVRSAGL